MKEIRRPLTIDETGTMLHVAEYLLAQADAILMNIIIAPDCAAPYPIPDKVQRMHDAVKVALEELER